MFPYSISLLKVKKMKDWTLERKFRRIEKGGKPCVM
jgi:hypothetical protein